MPSWEVRLLRKVHRCGAFTAASEQLKKLKAIDANTQSVIGGNGGLKYTLADAVSVVKDAMSQKTLVISMMQRAPL